MTYARYFAALLLSLVAVYVARADWINYNVAVSNSLSGPFAPTANLWTQGLLTVDLAAEPGPPIVFNGNAYLSLGLLTANFGSPETPPANFPQMPFAFQITGKKPLILSGRLSIPSNGDVNFANVTASDRSFTVTLETMERGGPAMPPSGVPGWTASFVVQSDIYAVVPLDELATVPEPSGMVLAGIGALILGAVRRKKL